MEAVLGSRSRFDERKNLILHKTKLRTVIKNEIKRRVLEEFDVKTFSYFFSFCFLHRCDNYKESEIYNENL